MLTLRSQIKSSGNVPVRPRLQSVLIWSAIALLLAESPTRASYHFMRIEQVIAGVEGDITAQAIQLRMRTNGQNQMQNSKLIAHDAAGENPITLIDFDDTVDVGLAGSRVLIASVKMRTYTTPVLEPDFIFTNLIPESYLAAGSITFENDEGTFLVCRLSWGGLNYTGSTLGAETNDDDGDFGPPYQFPLPTDSFMAISIDSAGDPGDKHTTNADEFALTNGPAVLINNSAAMFTLGSADCSDDPLADTDGDGICDSVDNCPITANTDQSDSDADGVGDSCDDCAEDPLKSEPGNCGCSMQEEDPDGDGEFECVSSDEESEDHDEQDEDESDHHDEGADDDETHDTTGDEMESDDDAPIKEPIDDEDADSDSPPQDEQDNTDQEDVEEVLNEFISSVACGRDEFIVPWTVGMTAMLRLFLQSSQVRLRPTLRSRTFRR